MNSLLEKVERMTAMILEILEVEPGTAEAKASLSDDELSRDEELNSDHKLIELCW